MIVSTARWLSIVLMPILATIPSGATEATTDAAIETSGARAWVSRFDGPAHRSDLPYQLAVSPDGSRVFVGGDSYAGGCSDLSTVAYDSSDGSQLWASRYDGAVHTCDDFAGIAIREQGDLVYVTGQAVESDAGDIVTIAYDAADGSQVWLAREERPFAGTDIGADIAIAPDGSTVYVAGTVQAATDCDPCPYHMLIAAYDAASGTRRWIDEYEGAEGTAFASALVVSTAGDVFVTGPGLRGPLESVAYDGMTGVRQWTAIAENDYVERYGLQGPKEVIDASSDGLAVFVAGSSGSGRYSVTAYAAADGSELWRIEKGSATFGYRSITASRAGNTVFLAAESKNNCLVVALDGADGSTIWRTVYEGRGLGASPSAIAVSADGTDVLVTGAQGRHKTWIYSFGTVVLDATNGDVRWSNAYGGRLGGYHLGNDIAAGPDGAVYVTGESEGPTRGVDFATIKYT